MMRKKLYYIVTTLLATSLSLLQISYCAADLDIFPDLTKYRDIDLKDYTYHYPNGDVVFFRTATNTGCSFEFGQVETCTGMFYESAPDGSAGKIECQEALLSNVANQPAQISLQPIQECSEPFRSRIVPIGFKISFRGNTCAIGEHNLIACTNNNHGFVLSDTQNWVF